MKIDQYNILRVVSGHFGLSVGQMFANNRIERIAYARHLYFYFMRRYSGYILPEIGLIGEDYGRKKAYDHATVLHGDNKIKDWLSINDPETVMHVEQIEMDLKYYWGLDKQFIPYDVNLLKQIA